jgi:hypothetical protein
MKRGNLPTVSRVRPWTQSYGASFGGCDTSRRHQDRKLNLFSPLQPIDSAAAPGSLPTSTFHLPSTMSAASSVLFILLTRPVAALTQFASGPNSCQIIGDPDVYGIGIRTGLYLQWFAAMIATIFEPLQSRIARTTSNIIILAALINTFRDIPHSNLVAIEWYLVIWLGFFLNVGNIPPSLAHVHQSTGSFATMLLLWLCILATQPWLYFFGIDNGKKKGCDARIFFFASISVYGRWRIFGKVASVIGCVCGLGGFAAALNVLVVGFVPPEPASDIDDSKVARYVLGAVQLISGAVCMTLVEMTIRTIDLSSSSLLDSGQLIPTLIGIFILFSVLFSVFRKRVRGTRSP